MWVDEPDGDLPPEQVADGLRDARILEAEESEPIAARLHRVQTAIERAGRLLPR